MRQLALTLLLVASLATTSGHRPQTFTSSSEYPRWGSKHFKDIATQAWTLWQARRITEADAVYRKGYEEALRANNIRAAVWFRIGRGGSQFAAGNYREALDDFLAAREVARRFGLRVETAIALSNLSSLYHHVYDTSSALMAAEEAYRLLPAGAYSVQRGQMLMQFGRVLLSRGELKRAIPVFTEAIEDASARGDLTNEAEGWDLLGFELIRAAKLPQAEAALSEALRLRLATKDPGLFATESHLAIVKLRRGDPDSAHHIIDSAFAHPRKDRVRLPEHYLYGYRAEIRRATGDLRGALDDYMRAIAGAEDWRSRGLSADEFRIGVDVFLDEFYDGAIGVAAQLYIETHDPRFEETSWELCERNRAASLRETSAAGAVWRKNLTPAYRTVADRLRQLEARRIGSGAEAPETPAEIMRLRMQLAEMEARAAAEEAAKTTPSSVGTTDESESFCVSCVGKPENFLHRISLTRFRKVLGISRVLVSFRLDDKASYRWTVSERGVKLAFLPGREKLGNDVRALREAVTDVSSVAADRGEALYSELFGGVESPEGAMWYVSLDDELFELPVGALVCGRKRGKPVYLAERRTIEAVPGAWAIGGASGEPEGGGFVGVGDGVYNTADPRYREAAKKTGKWTGALRVAANSQVAGVQLPRLVASRHEVERAGEMFGGKVMILTGVQADREHVIAALASKPRIIHIASHFLSERSGNAAIILGIRPGPGNQPQLELLTAADVADLRIPGAIVVMSGCSSAAGQILPAAGLLGLARSWLAAGARAVIATQWATPDDTGNLFACFYSHLREMDQGDRLAPAEALRRAQVEMLESGGWRSEPKYWAAYQIIGRSN